MPRMTAPKGATSATYDGETYTVANGFITVPHEALAPLMSHGFTPTGEADEQEEEAAAEKQASKRAPKTKAATDEAASE